HFSFPLETFLSCCMERSKAALKDDYLMAYHPGSIPPAGRFMLVRQKRTLILAGVYTKYTYPGGKSNSFRVHLINNLHRRNSLEISTNNRQEMFI
ncbi:MAG: hypothetical protein IKT99_00765, partial [Oscillospiraceae bacterium]|nr:hypothetical protein [Oscillospiraceae bacterium]